MSLFNKSRYYDTKYFPDYLVGMNHLYTDLFSQAKGFRSQLVANTSKHLELDKKVVLLLQKTVEFIHSASLLHDDLIDQSVLRRNKTTAWLKYSPEYAILSGDYLMASVMRDLSKYGNLKLVQYTANIALSLIEGEWMQDATIKKWNIDLKEVDRVYRLKTGSLFIWCLEAPFICKNKQNPKIYAELEKFGETIGLLFQRADDLIDFDIRNDSHKNVLSDLQSGYLNSFGIFLFQQLSKSKCEQLKKCKRIDLVHSVVGKSKFDKIVNEFDEINKKLIDNCEVYLKNISNFLLDSEKGLVSDLQKIPNHLYWRK